MSPLNMQSNSNALLEINQVVIDKLHVWIKCPQLKQTQLRYCISNSNKSAIRKGSFSGETIQLNLLLIPDGNYLFNLFNDQGTEYSMPFVKKAKQ